MRIFFSVSLLTTPEEAAATALTLPLLQIATIPQLPRKGLLSDLARRVESKGKAGELSGKTVRSSQAQLIEMIM